MKTIIWVLDFFGVYEKIKKKIYIEVLSKDVAGQIQDAAYWFNDNKPVQYILHSLARRFRTYQHLGDRFQMRDEFNEYTKK